MKKVIVRWHDAESFRGWRTKENAFTLAEMGTDVAESIGFLLKKNKKVVALVQSTHLDNVGELLMIPRGCIIDIRKI